MQALLKVVPFLLVLVVPLALVGCQQPPADVAGKPVVNEVAETSVADVSAPVAEAGVGVVVAESSDAPEASAKPSALAPTRQDAYADFTQARYDELLGKQPFALFFHASWCPTCWAVEADILKNINDLPEGAVILKVNYDTATELKKTYRINSQSVIVMVNSNGALVKTLVAPSFQTLKNNFVNLLP